MLFFILERKTSVSIVDVGVDSKNWPGSLSVVPYTSSELEHPRSSLGTERIPNKIKGSSSTQLLLLSLAFSDALS